MAWDRGFSVAIVSSTLNFEFIERGASVPVPGHAPVDAHDVHVALDAHRRATSTRATPTASARASTSATRSAPSTASTSRPKSRRTRQQALCASTATSCSTRRCASSTGWSASTPSSTSRSRSRPTSARPRCNRILRKAARVGRQALAERNRMPSYSRLEAPISAAARSRRTAELPFTNEEAEFLIGLAFRRSLQEILYASQQRRGSRRPAHRANAAAAALRVRGDRRLLVRAVLLRVRASPTTAITGTIGSADEMIAANDLHAIAEPGCATIRSCACSPTATTS